MSIIACIRGLLLIAVFALAPLTIIPAGAVRATGPELIAGAGSGPNPAFFAIKDRQVKRLQHPDPGQAQPAAAQTFAGLRFEDWMVLGLVGMLLLLGGLFRIDR
jgi:hypothetical protein